LPALPLYAYQAAVFEDFRVESRTDNVITTELLLTNMAHALKPGAAAHSVTIKLTKRGSVPYLTLEMDVRARAQIGSARCRALRSMTHLPASRQPRAKPSLIPPLPVHAGC
jgi:hypothetical protein